MLTDAPIFGILASGRVNSVFPPDVLAACTQRRMLREL